MKTDRQQTHLKLFIGVLAISFLLVTGCVSVDTRNVDVRPWNRPSCGTVWGGTSGRGDAALWVFIGFCVVDCLFAICNAVAE